MSHLLTVFSRGSHPGLRMLRFALTTLALAGCAGASTDSPTVPPVRRVQTRLRVALSNLIALTAPHDSINRNTATVLGAVLDQSGDSMGVAKVQAVPGDTAILRNAYGGPEASAQLVARDSGTTLVTGTTSWGALLLSSTLSVTVLRPRYLATRPSAVCVRVDLAKPRVLDTVRVDYRDGRYHLFEGQVPTGLTWWSSDTTRAYVDAGGAVRSSSRAGDVQIWARDDHGSAYYTPFYMDPTPLGLAMTCGRMLGVKAMHGATASVRAPSAWTDSRKAELVRAAGNVPPTATSVRLDDPRRW